MLGLQHVKITPKMLNLVCEIDEFKGAWSAMENHTTSLQLLGEFSSFGRNFREIAASWQGKPLNVELLCRLHALFIGAKQVSIFKEESTPLLIEKDGETIGALQTATPEEVRALMPRLMTWIEGSFEKRDPHPLFSIAIFTAVLLILSPFEKGNEKLAKMLVVMLLFKAGYSYAPYSTLDSLMQEKAEELYATLKHTQTTLANGKVEWDPWLEFFFSLLKAQKDKLQVKEKSDRLSMKEIERLTRGKRSTLKLRLGELVEGGYLMRHGQARATWYSKV
jgi:Fic family protein